MKLSGIVAFGAVLLAASPSYAGTLIVAGDTTIASRFVSAVNTGNPNLAGNIAFAQNILGDGDTASIYRFSITTTGFTGGVPNPPLGQQFATAYATLPGVTATTFTTGLTEAAIAGADLLVILARSNAYTALETSIMRGFLEAGGNVLLTGESTDVGSFSNNNLNALLAGLGSTIRLNQVTQGLGDQFATGSEILANDLTAGVTSFGYGRTTTVTGGTTLFLNDSGNAFVASETIAAPIPEPATWAMMICGFGLIGGAMRRRRQDVTVQFSA